MGNIDLKRTTQDLLVPTCIILLVLFLRPYADFYLQNTLGINATAIILLLIPAFLSIKFKQFTEFYFILSLSIVFSAFLAIDEQLLNIDESKVSALKHWLLVLLPLNFLLIKALQMPGALSSASRWFILILIIEAIAFFFAYDKNLFSPIEFLLLDKITLPFKLEEPVSQLAFALFLLALLVQVINLIIKNSSIQISIFGSLILMGISFHLYQLPQMLPLAIIGISIILSVGITQDSHDMAFMDALTQMPGRRAMEQELKQLGKRYCIAMLDIDHFKKLNDKYGHDVGDQVLKMVAKNIKKVSGGGRAARYGGEEFAIIFPGKSLLDVIPHLESVRLHIENSPFILRDKERPKKMPKSTGRKSNKPHNTIHVTISTGAAERSRVDRSTDQVMKAADNALYKAKKQGRNQVCY